MEKAFLKDKKMKYKLILDKDNYLVGFVHTDTEEDTYELDTSEMKMDHIECYKMEKGLLVFDEEKYETQLAKQELYTQEIMPESYGEYRIIKEADYKTLISNITILWIFIIGIAVYLLINKMHKKK